MGWYQTTLDIRTLCSDNDFFFTTYSRNIYILLDIEHPTFVLGHDSLNSVK